MTSPAPLKAIDLYAGVGGWAIGLSMAGIDVRRSYEWWKPAAETHSANLGGDVRIADIRTLDLAEFPEDVDVVVGSPPCTQFSYANRGGSGDIEDGLKDIRKFLEVVAHVRPRRWAMENVPRVAKILRQELQPDGSLAEFKHLVKVIEVVDSSEWGVPQRRRRMIAGDFDFSLLEAYRFRQPKLTLGDVIDRLQFGGTDPVFGWTLSSQTTDHIPEEPLTEEETRMNRDQKTYHRVYNKMSFPELMESPSRTVTALCTRVSRESIIVSEGAGYRRLTIRERATLQSFPLHYQFFGPSFASRVKLIGNAIPPLLTFNIAHAILGTAVDQVQIPQEAPSFALGGTNAVPDRPRRNYPERRKFAAAIPGLRFGSGMRFELHNTFDDPGAPNWKTEFFYGPARNVVSLKLDGGISDTLFDSARDWMGKVDTETRTELRDWIIRPDELQEAWLRSDMERGPYGLVDALGRICETARGWLPYLPKGLEREWLSSVFGVNESQFDDLPSSKKLLANASALLAGAAVCSIFNEKAARPTGSKLKNRVRNSTADRLNSQVLESHEETDLNQ